MTVVLDSTAALRRARAAIGTEDGLGRCLENVYQWYGSVESVGPGHGHYSIALAGWDYSPEKTYPIDLAPAGTPVWFGVSPTRTDRNKAAGDVGLSIGNGHGIFTDSYTGRPGIMSFADRAAQIRRPPLGFTTDFLGHPTSAGLAWLGTVSARPVVALIPQKENTLSDVKIVPDASSKKLILHNAVTGGRVDIKTPADASDLSAVINGTGEVSEARLAILDAQYFRPAGPLAMANIIASIKK